MKKLNIIMSTAAVLTAAVLCAACTNLAQQFLLGSYGTYKWTSGGTQLTLSSNESNFQKHFAGSGKRSVTLTKENINGTDYLTSGEYYLDAKEISENVWSGIFYLAGFGFRSITIKLESGGRCTIQPGLSVESGIKFPEGLTIKGIFTSEAASSATMTPSTGMPTYAKQFFAAVKSGSLKTQWRGKEVETFTDRKEDTETDGSGNKTTTETWKGSPRFFINGTGRNVYYKKITKRNSSDIFSSGTFEIFIPKGAALRTELY